MSDFDTAFEVVETKKDPEKEKIYLAIEEITKIIDKNEKEQKNNEEIINEITSYINEKNLDCLKILDRTKATLAHKYCADKKYFHLNIYLLTVEKILSDKNKLNQYLLIEDICHTNIFESASELGDIKIFEILSTYLENNDEVLSAIVKEERNNIFHISARENKVLSLLFFYEFYKNDSSVLNHKNNLTQTPLMTACYNSNYEYVHAIINLGADFKILDKDNKNALFFAVDSNSTRITKYLILLGINKNQLDKRNRKAASYSSDKGIHHILDDHNLFDLLFKCPILYQSLKGHITHIYYLSLLAFLIVIHFLILILFNTSGKTDKCNHLFYTVRFSSETFIMIMTLITEAFGIIFYFCFHYMHKKVTSVAKVNIAITNDGEEKLYKLYSSNKNFCAKCRKIMSIGTQHCIACDKCIENWDHHCFWLNVCIDDKNKKYFKFFMIQLFVIIFMNFIMSVFCLCDLIIFPKIYYAFISECAEDQSFNFISVIILFIFIIYFLADIYFLYVALLPFFVEYLCISNEIEKTITNNKEIKDSPLLHEDDNVV